MSYEFPIFTRQDATTPDPTEMLNEVSESATTAVNWLQANGTSWGLWLMIGIGLFLGLRFLRAIIAGLFRNGKKPANAVRNIIADLLASTNSLFILIYSLSIALPITGLVMGTEAPSLPEDGATWLARGLMVLAVIQFAIWARVLARALMDGVVAKSVSDSASFESAQNLLNLFLNFAIFAIAGIMIVDNLGGNVAGLIAGLGVGGIAIGLAAQGIIADLFASLSIILDKPFVKGDFIVFKNFAGTVDRIGLKTTRLKALSGQQLVVSNANLLSTEIDNYKRMAERRIVFSVGVTYQTPRTKLEVIPGKIREAVDAVEGTRCDRVNLSKFADSSINFECVWFVLSPDYNEYMNRQEQIYLNIHRFFEEMDVEFAYPTQTVWLENSSGTPA